MKVSEAEKALTEFLTELKYSEKSDRTLKKYKTDISKFFNFAKDKELTINKDLTLEYKSHLCELQFKTSSLNSYIIALNKYLKWLGLNDSTVKLIKQQRKNSLEDVISMTDYKRLLRHAKKMGMLDMYFIMRVLGSTGIRIEELKFITADSIKSNYIKVNNKGKERDITIPQQLCRELRKYCKEQNIKTGYIFLGAKPNKMLHQSTIWRRLKRISASAKVNKNKVHAHSFRHLFAKEFMKKHNNSIELADILGHNSLESTRIYTRSTTKEKRNKLDVLGF